VHWVARPWRRGDLAGAFLAVAATDDRGVNRDVWAEAEAERVLLNAVDDVDYCHFHAPAILRRGELAVAISTGGKSPALAVRIRERIAEVIGPEYGDWLDLLGSFREELVRRYPDPRERTAVWYRLVDSDALELVRQGDLAGARRRLAGMVAGAAAAPLPPARRIRRPIRKGVVYLVGAGPGDPGLVTARGLEILRRADVVAYDRLVHPDLLREAPASAERVFVGKRPHGDASRQEEINRLLIDRARAGRTVVRLKGGDPFVFGRGAEEGMELRRAGVPFVVVPGVSSAVAAPGAAGIPVTCRGHGSSFAVLTGHEAAGAAETDWEALARIPTLVVLMGVSGLEDVTGRLLGQGRNPVTPAAVVESGTLDRQRTVVGTLATIAGLAAEARIAPPATLIVGDVVKVREHLVGQVATLPVSTGDSE
jgi:uroporphyrin-III C-methyltransferase/precorrin-2 dehydrogenase/sirohydrochlorin ferrochelatase